MLILTVLGAWHLRRPGADVFSKLATCAQPTAA